YLRDKRVEGAGHPPVYLIESQDLVNQFSFWPRYDQFVDAPARPAQSPDEPFTEQKGGNLFVGRSALLVRNYAKHPPHNIRAAFESTELVGTIELRRFGEPVRDWEGFFCRHYRAFPLWKTQLDHPLFLSSFLYLTRKRTCRSCNRSCAPRSQARITRLFLSMTARPIGARKRSNPRPTSESCALKKTPAKAPLFTREFWPRAARRLS